MLRETEDLRLQWYLIDYYKLKKNMKKRLKYGNNKYRWLRIITITKEKEENIWKYQGKIKIV